MIWSETSPAADLGNFSLTVMSPTGHSFSELGISEITDLAVVLAVICNSYISYFRDYRFGGSMF